MEPQEAGKTVQWVAHDVNVIGYIVYTLIRIRYNEI